MNTMHAIQDLLKNYASLHQGTHSRFFKTGPGQYAEHDTFMGISVPMVRKIAKEFSHIPLEEIEHLLASPYNEERLLALFILVSHYQRVNDEKKEQIYNFYIKNIDSVNNWNLVDSSAHLIVGAHLLHGDKSLLVEYAHSNNLWKKRVAIIATLYFIRKSELDWTFKIAQLLLNDTHDLIHKAVGWMLREAGQKDVNQLKAFLNEHVVQMPRTMLRYAIEKFPQEERTFYLKK